MISLMDSMSVKELDCSPTILLFQLSCGCAPRLSSNDVGCTDSK